MSVQSRTLLKLTALVAAAIASGCALFGDTGYRVMDSINVMAGGKSRYDPEEERIVGEQAAATLLGAAPLLKDAGVQRYVNRVGVWVAAQSDRPELTWRFAVLDTASVNAFAAPGGYVFITRGLLVRLRNEAELAGVLGHEIAHVTQRHHLKVLVAQDALSGIGGKLKEKLASRPEAQNEYVKEIAGAARTMYSRGLDRSDEYDADRVGVVFAARAGYDPYGLPAALQTLDTLRGDDPALALLFQTHPAPADRLAQLDARMAGRLDVEGERPLGADRFRRNLKSLAPAQAASN